MISETRKILLSAGAAAALMFAAGGAMAREDRACADEACGIELMFAAADAPAGGEAPVSLAAPRYGTRGFDL